MHFEIYTVHSPTNALFINLVKSFKFTLKYSTAILRSDIIEYFSVNLKLLTKLINSAFVSVCTTLIFVISVDTPTILTTDVRSFLQFLYTNERPEPQVRPRPLSYTQFENHCSLTILPFELLTTKLSTNHTQTKGVGIWRLLFRYQWCRVRLIEIIFLTNNSHLSDHVISSFLRRSNFHYSLLLYVRTAVAQWLRCCTTNRNVAGSIPDGVIGIFHWYKILPIALWPWCRLSL